MTPPPPQTHIIDVRTPAEFATGHLTSPLAPTLNIEYQDIGRLEAIVYAARGIHVQKHDHIFLYCRSGRRSALALRTLVEAGFGGVRDWGGLEEAGRELEEAGRELGMERGGMGEGAKEGGEGRVKEFGKLVEGLKGLEGA